MGRAKDFTRELEKLFRRRTHWLRTVFGAKRPGSSPQMSRRHVDRTIEKLQTIASSALAGKLARSEFEEAVEFRKSWHPKRGKGSGHRAKKTAFDSWFDDHVGSGPTIYVFWSGRRCVYVGKTEGSGRRVSSHFEKFWFLSATRVDIYAVSGKRSLSALECLAIHRFQPRRNRAKAERRKWTRRCPMCAINKDIEAELRHLFRLRA